MTTHFLPVTLQDPDLCDGCSCHDEDLEYCTAADRFVEIDDDGTTQRPEWCPLLENTWKIEGV